VLFHQVKEEHLSTSSDRVLAADGSVGAQSFVTYAVRQFVVLGAAVALESTRERNEAGHLFHHPVVDVAEALLADGARFEAFGLARSAHDVTFAALDDGTGHPIVTNWAVEQAY